MLTLVAGPLAMVTYKVVFLDYSMSDVLPVTRYQVTYRLELDGHGGAASVRAFLPAPSPRQIISDERIDAPDFH
ncbi:MAG: transglutaminase, partial [Myxococcota bacterium]